MLLRPPQVNSGTAVLGRKRSLEGEQPTSVAAQLLLNSLNIQPPGYNTAIYSFKNNNLL